MPVANGIKTLPSVITFLYSPLLELPHSLQPFLPRHIQCLAPLSFSTSAPCGASSYERPLSFSLCFVLRSPRPLPLIALPTMGCVSSRQVCVLLLEVCHKYPFSQGCNIDIPSAVDIPKLDADTALTLPLVVSLPDVDLGAGMIIDHDTLARLETELYLTKAIDSTDAAPTFVDLPQALDPIANGQPHSPGIAEEAVIGSKDGQPPPLVHVHDSEVLFTWAPLSTIIEEDEDEECPVIRQVHHEKAIRALVEATGTRRELGKVDEVDLKRASKLVTTSMGHKKVMDMDKGLGQPSKDRAPFANRTNRTRDSEPRVATLPARCVAKRSSSAPVASTRKSLAAKAPSKIKLLRAKTPAPRSIPAKKEFATKKVSVKVDSGTRPAEPRARRPTPSHKAVTPVRRPRKIAPVPPSLPLAISLRSAKKTLPPVVVKRKHIRVVPTLPTISPLRVVKKVHIPVAIPSISPVLAPICPLRIVKKNIGTHRIPELVQGDVDSATGSEESDTSLEWPTTPSRVSCGSLQILARRKASLSGEDFHHTDMV